MIVICAGCNGPIVDRFLLRVLDQTWHSSCVQCHECRCTLTEKCFSRDGQLFCKEDFFRRFGTKCSGCNQGIAPSDLVRRARDQVYHVTCFNCVVCGKQLSTGDQLYFLDENQFICKNDYCNSKLTEYRDELKMDDDDDYDDDKPIGLHDDDAGSRESTAFLSSRAVNCPTARYAANGSAAVVSGVTSSGFHDDQFKDEGWCPKRQDGAVDASTKIEPEMSGNFGAKSAHLLNTDSNCSVDSNCSEGSSNNNNNNNNNSYKERDKENSDTQAPPKDVADSSVVSGAKRRGPRTTIKAKQLETLKSAFASTPKPTRHIREQLAQETGLNMRVIQVWFQNRRSKERRMKQLSAMGARRQFYRNPRRLRMIRPGEDFPDDSPALHGYYAENCDFYPGYSGYDFFAMSSASDPGQLAYVPLPSSSGGGPLTNPSNADQVSAHLHDGRLFMSDAGGGGGGGGGGGSRGSGAGGKSTGGLLDPMHLIPAPVASPSAAVDVSTHPYDNGHGLLATTPDHALYMSQQQQQLADNWR